MDEELLHLKVLIVDDHMLVRQYVRNALQEEHIGDLHFAKDGGEAIDMIEKAHIVKQSFDIVFMDWDMPNVNGFGALTYLRHKPEYAKMAIVMLTAEADMHSIMKAMSSGATSYIVKPPSVGEIRKKLAEVIDWLKKKRAE
jgi:CheY-like chemotaxis protein